MQIKNPLLRISCTRISITRFFVVIEKPNTSFARNMAVRMGSESIKYVIKIIYLPIHSPDSQFVSSCLYEWVRRTPSPIPPSGEFKI